MWLGSWLFEKTDWNTIAQQLSVRRNVEKGDHDWHSCSSCSQPFDTDTNDGKESILVFIIWLHWSAMKGELPLVSLAVCISFTTRTANPIYTTLEKFENRVYSENACIKCYPSTQSQRDAKNWATITASFCLRKTDDHLIIVTSLFSKSFVFKMLSVNTKT